MLFRSSCIIAIIAFIDSILLCSARVESQTKVDAIRQSLFDELQNTKLKRIGRDQKKIFSAHGKKNISCNATISKTSRGGGHLVTVERKSLKPSLFQLCIRASCLGVYFTPCFATSGFAVISKKFREKIWYKMFTRSLARSGPAWIKWGQWASTRTDMFPETLCKELCILHANAPTHSWKFTQKTIEEALGISAGDLYEVFEEFNPVPIASGSIAQIHKAKIRSNVTISDSYINDVAIKVRHPNVEDLIDKDFRIMQFIGKLFDAIPSLSWLHVSSSLEQFSHTMAAQADLDVESHHLDVLNDNFRRWKKVNFPRPIYSTSSVIIETFAEGRIVTSILDLFETKANLLSKGREEETRLTDVIPVELAKFIVTKGLSLYLKMLLVDNLMHADFHSGNIMVNSPAEIEEILCDVGRSITVVDAGMVAEFDEEESLNFIGLLASLGEGDGLLAANAVLKFSKKQNLSKKQIKLFQQDMIELFAERCRGYGTDVNVGNVLRGVLTLIRDHRVRIDANYATLVVNALNLEGMARRICPDYNIIDMSRPLLGSYFKLCASGRSPKRKFGQLVFKTILPFQYVKKVVSDEIFFRRRQSMRITIRRTASLALKVSFSAVAIAAALQSFNNNVSMPYNEHRNIPKTKYRRVSWYQTNS